MKEIKKRDDIPYHVAVIMDGNRRFAKELGLQEKSGHEKGREKLEEMLDWCTDLDIKILTVYAFSTENFKRDTDEVQKLMDLFKKNFRKAAEDERVHEHGIKIKAIGNIEKLPNDVKEAIRYAEDKTKGYDNYFFNIAVGYGGREEIIHGIQQIAADVKDGRLDVDQINEQVFADKLYTSDFPDPDLILRTSGEERISNFLLWQSAYSELYFTDVYWPGFRKIDFLRAIRSYQNRHRRIGE